jgi:4-amino-4-deoxy-L-arabinose transferase-like glycosyltransferase
MNAPRLLNIAAAGLIGIFCIQAILTIPHLSATSDEPIHIAAGYSYWKTRDFRMNPEHPPLAKLLAAIPLLAIRPRFDQSDETWNARIEDAFAFRFLYGNNADRILFWSRATMVLLAAFGAAVTFMWARDLFGGAAGIFAVTLYAFCPNLIGHGMLVTTDVPLAVFTVLTLYLFWKRGNNPSWQSDMLTGLALGAAMASKFSGAALPIVIIVFCLVRRQIKSLFIIGAASVLAIEAAYLFSAVPLLYFRNMGFINANHVKNYPFYLLGQFKQGGWWYYFPAAFVFKATLPTVILIVLAAVAATRGFVDVWGETILLATIALYLIVITLGADQIGVRYILPIFPLFFIWVSRIVPTLLTARPGKALLAAFLAWHIWSGVSAFPNYIPYFNEMAGGISGGAALLDDSNIDWGQGLKQAADYIRIRQLEKPTIYAFDPFEGPGTEYYGLPRNLRGAEVFKRLLRHRPTPGTYIISVHYVTRMSLVDPAWKIYKPIDRIGESLWVYAF